jgi:hypothetical protein
MRYMDTRPRDEKRPGLDLEVLARPVRLDLSLNDLRILVGCFRAIAYRAEVDDEPYLDPDAIELMRRLELQYGAILKEAEADPGNHR